MRKKQYIQRKIQLLEQARKLVLEELEEKILKAEEEFAEKLTKLQIKLEKV